MPTPELESINIMMIHAYAPAHALRNNAMQLQAGSNQAGQAISTNLTRPSRNPQFGLTPKNEDLLDIFLSLIAIVASFGIVAVAGRAIDQSINKKAPETIQTPVTQPPVKTTADEVKSLQK